MFPADPNGGSSSVIPSCSGILDSTTTPPVCYEFNPTLSTYESASSASQQHDDTRSTLATISSEYQLDIVNSLLESQANAGVVSVWIGGRIRQQTPQDIWKWLRGMN